MSYLFYLDGDLYDNPAQDRTLSTRIKRNSNLNGLLVTQDAKIDFQGNAYDYLFSQFFDGLCTEVEVEIWEDCETSVLIYDGIIKISDIKIDFQQCSIETSIEDRDFFSYINNNKSVKVPLGVDTLSKTGVVIPSLQAYTSKFFIPSTGVVDPTFQHKGWRVFDVMQFILDYITDNRIELESDLLSGLSDEEELFLTQGRSIQPPAFPLPEDVKMSFKDLYETIQRLYNTSFIIETSNYSYSRAVLRIEKQDYFYQNSGDYVMTDVKDLKINADNKEVYSSIAFGGEDQEGVTITIPPYSAVNEPLYGWSSEQFHLQGQCNQDNELDLSVKFQIASNVIEDVQLWGSPEFDDDLFLIEVDNVDTAAYTCTAVLWDYYGQAGPTYYYNLGINNEQVLLRQGGYLHNDVQQFLEGATDQFKVTGSQTTYKSNDAGICVETLVPASTCPVGANEVQPFPYDDDTTPGNYNNGGHYNIGTYQYTCPSTGDYTFDHTAFFSTFGIQPFSPGVVPSKLEIIIGFENITANTNVVQNQVYFNNASGTLSASSTLPCTAGDVIEATIDIVLTRGDASVPTFGVTFTDSSYFSCTSTPNSLGGASDINTELFKALLFKFEYPLDGSDFRDILEDPTQLITITSNEQIFKGWIDELKYNHWENKAQITLRSNAINQDT